ncbi:hypothetical protein SAMN04488056_12228 [Cohaesibacter marisflavi]|uniref:Uncharacterized protein n=1 Tax=Cohaesibacter marisflavi TaxID=655353 RepID=A0A1I5MMZ8_9HYPH|nr:hypothetical protein SAMN04488056_12228 [Cohaesibacter marisflavi]
MRRFQPSPEQQLNLFSPLEGPYHPQTPHWQTLPQETRIKITRLMARMMMEHGANHASKASIGQDIPLLEKESGNV